MPRGARAPWASHDDYLAYSLIVLIVALCVGTYLIWHNFHETLSLMYAEFAYGETQALRPFTHRLDYLAQMVQFANYDRVTLANIWAVQSAIGAVVAIPAAVLVALLSIPCFLLAAPSRFTGKVGLSELIKIQAPHFPALQAFAERQLRLVPLDRARLRPADPALHPAEWVDRYGRAKDGSFDEVKVRTAFADQLGPLWKGPATASPSCRVMFSILALHLAGDRKGAQNLLGKLASSVQDASGEKDSGPDNAFPVTSLLIQDADETIGTSPVVAAAAAITARHAYAHSALMSLLNAARQRHGILPPAAFAALKLIDRPLWYALHSLGFPGDGPGQNIHPNPRIEAAGVRAHWAAECQAAEPLILPSIGAAVVASRAAMGETVTGRWTPGEAA